MGERNIISSEFYNRQVVQVARDLLGTRLVRVLDGVRVSGIISETEAYDGMKDLACHARVGKTKRNAVMFGAAGHAYVYFTYGMHWCLNIVTGAKDYPAAVLIRAIEPQEGLEIIEINRGKIARKNWTNGPAKLTQALQINQLQNGLDITRPDCNLWIENGLVINENVIKTGPRIGITNTPEPWRSMPWRFWFEATQQAELEQML
jgi:DNA-3-methyladenine glycosylase